jgi:CRISPR-associated protein Csb1
MSTPAAAPDTQPLNLKTLQDAVAGNAAAFRCRRKLQPAGGPGDKVFPPTFAGKVYAVEKRRLPGRPEPVTCVLLDSVQSQANRMEQALQDAVDAKLISLPIVEVDFSQAYKDGMLIEDIGRITSLQAPHRLADAILRDSEFKEPNGTLVLFRDSSIGRPMNDANPRNATPIYKLCPTALLFGMWDSTGPKRALGAKFERAMVSEIVGIGAELGDLRRGVRRDPLEISSQAKVLKEPDGDWKPARDAELKGAVSPSEINHSSVPFPKRRDTKTEENYYDGVTIDHAEQTTTLSLAVLRRLQFPGASPEAALAARTSLAALGLIGATLAFTAGEALRSRCLLWPAEDLAWELLAEPGATPPKFRLDAASATALLASATAQAAAADIAWGPSHRLVPSAKLLEITKRSQEIHVTTPAES